MAIFISIVIVGATLLWDVANRATLRLCRCRLLRGGIVPRPQRSAVPRIEAAASLL